MVYVGCLLIVVLSAYLGKSYASKYVMRDKFYRTLNEMCLFFKTNIGFNHTKLEQLYNDFLSQSNNKFSSQLLNLKKLCLENSNLQGVVYGIKKNLSFIPNEEVDILVSKFSQIGTCAENIELGKLEELINFTSVMQKEYSEQRKILEPLSYKLSVSIGLVISILII